ncbi:hypothetical protein ACP4OV_003025 [Aristida adscensionis]
MIPGPWITTPSLQLDRLICGCCCTWPRKRRSATCKPPGGAAATATTSTATSAAAEACTLPTDVLLEIVARADAAAIFCVAAACRPLRREMILSPSFLRRVPGPLLGSIDGSAAATFSLVHPATPAAASFAEGHLAPFMSRSAGGLLERYLHVESLGGLVLLERREILRRGAADEVCVYDPMTGARAFLPWPPAIAPGSCEFVLLTAAADGIGQAFLLLAADLFCYSPKLSVKVQALSSDAGGRWGPATINGEPPALPRGQLSMAVDALPVVLGGVVHWLVGSHVLTYGVATAAVGTIELPADCEVARRELCLGSTPDGSLGLFGASHGFTVLVWVMSPGGCGGVWRRRLEVDTAATLRSMTGPWVDDAQFRRWCCGGVDVVSVGDQRSDVVYMRLRGLVFLLHVETGEIRSVANDVANNGVPYTVDLSSRLSATKIF